MPAGSSSFSHGAGLQETYRLLEIIINREHGIIKKQKSITKVLMLTCLLALIPSISLAGIQPENEYGLLLSPNLCLLSQDEKICQMKLKVSWRTPKRGNYCLLESKNRRRLHCWQQKSSEQIEVELTLTGNTDLFFVDQQLGTIIYQQSISLQRQIVRYRQKRRNPWRFY